ncbi:hypothetical protein O6H91_20G049300 [Diphasiastrum complanatum]|uniref:Uncharacterized protein n=2 Tax=Diphasiastrum complanatum TaxID=34168 RepID=A0ACC2AQ87_DIPCM|nr:hypothetical protein O6H91_20G049300 [Diphasiastrum complanatum]KAJ7519661.1 hypothetical protein O6H91_20G049300 [Diphasiastrum complanatum]
MVSCANPDSMVEETHNPLLDNGPMNGNSRHGEAKDEWNGVAEWKIRANPAAVNSKNPIRDVMESLPPVVARNGKLEISLAQGDPCAFGHLLPPDGAIEALLNTAESSMFNGYAHSAGLLESRRVIAKYHSINSKLAADDVYITVGCSQAIQLCIEALACPGSNILLPRPGFPIYETFSSYYGLQCRHYDLLPDHDWEIDLEQLESLVDCNTVAMIICNPGNPCGAVYSHEHLSQIAGLAERLTVPIIADEIYAHMVFGTRKFVPMATFSWKVPILVAGGISKRWLVPGWRLGWIILHDPRGILKRGRVVEALTRLVQMTIGTCTLVQAVVPDLLLHTSSDFHQKTLLTLKLGAELCFERVKRIRGLSCPSAPEGAMYMMVKIDFLDFVELKNDLEFAAVLRCEELVTVLPGTAFGLKNWIRIVFVAPLSHLKEAWDRIEIFCQRHVRRKP